MLCCKVVSLVFRIPSSPSDLVYINKHGTMTYTLDGKMFTYCDLSIIALIDLRLL